MKPCRHCSTRDARICGWQSPIDVIDAVPPCVLDFYAEEPPEPGWLDHVLVALAIVIALFVIVCGVLSIT